MFMLWRMQRSYLLADTIQMGETLNVLCPISLPRDRRILLKSLFLSVFLHSIFEKVFHVFGESLVLWYFISHKCSYQKAQKLLSVLERFLNSNLSNSEKLKLHFCLPLKRQQHHYLGNVPPPNPHHDVALKFDMCELNHPVPSILWYYG